MKWAGRGTILGFCLCLAAAAQAQHGSHGSHGSSEATQPAHPFPTDVANLQEIVAPSEVRLDDGDRYTLTAKPAKQKIGDQWIRRLAYNGSVPGPIFRVRQGSTVTVTLKNDMDSPTTLHPHGLRLDPKSDGIPGVAQSPIQPGQSYEYGLTFPDAGVFWYHPHIREDYGQDSGLYGLFIVEPAQADVYNPVHRELPLVLDDLLIDPKQAYDASKVTHTLMGRYGNTYLVNGTVSPTLAVTQGEIIRFFVLNASNARVFALAIPGIKMKLVGGDNGLYEKEEWKDTVILAPGERAIIEAQFPTAGQFSILHNKPKMPATLGRIDVKAGPLDPIQGSFDQLRTNDDATTSLAAVRQLLQKKVDKKLKLTLAMDHSKLPMDMGSDGHDSMGIEWDDDMPAMNAASDTENVVWKFVDEQTSKENMNIKWELKKGQFTRISIFNDPQSMHPMQHPIHFHGQRFAIVSVDGKPTSNLVWKDTALIPAGARLDILLEASNPGNWMGHCHISEHLEDNMMFNFNVVP